MSRLGSVFVAVATIHLGTAAIADDASRDCRAEGDRAYVIMIGRQGGISLSDMIEGSVNEIGSREVILDAFEMPRLVDQKAANLVAEQFRDRWALRCYREQG